MYLRVKSQLDDHSAHAANETLRERSVEVAEVERHGEEMMVR